MDLAVGFFDGVHLGHRRILSQADVALTFAEHPLSVLAPDRAPALLMTLDERLTAIRKALRPNPLSSNPPQCEVNSKSPQCEVERVRALPFTREFAAMPPADFAAMLKRDYPNLGTIFCGPNWNFGAGGAGNANYLQSLGFRVGTVPFEVTGTVPSGVGTVPIREGSVPVGAGSVPVGAGSVPVSSTRIRAALASGDLKGAAAMLGCRYAVSGEVRPGKGKGGELGYPTFNLHPANSDLRRLLPLGVYAVSTEFGRALANWGVAPTMGENAWSEPVFEVHLIDGFGGERPPAAMTIELEAFIRPERKFQSIAELQKQIANDVGCVRNIHARQ